MNLTGYSRDTASTACRPESPQTLSLTHGRCRARTCDPLRVKQPKPTGHVGCYRGVTGGFAGGTRANGHTETQDRHGCTDAVFGRSRDNHGMNA